MAQCISPTPTIPAARSADPFSNPRVDAAIVLVVPAQLLWISTHAGERLVLVLLQVLDNHRSVAPVECFCKAVKEFRPQALLECGAVRVIDQSFVIRVRTAFIAPRSKSGIGYNNSAVIGCTERGQSRPMSFSAAFAGIRRS